MENQKFKINNYVKIDPDFVNKIYNQGDKKFNGYGVVMEICFDPRFIKVLATRARGKSSDPIWVMADHLEIIKENCSHFTLA